MVFVGRDAELAVLRELWGEPAAVLVAGEAGIGKTRLVTEFAAGLEGDVLVGAAVEHDAGGLPFAPFTAVLREVVGRLGVAGVLERLPHGVPGELPRLLPALGPVPELDDRDLARARLFEQVLGLLAGLGPVLLVVEDLHWADGSSRELLHFLVRNQRSAPKLMIVATSRDPDQLPWTRRVELGRLDRAAVAAILGGAPEPARVEEVFRRSEGNPLLVEALAEAGTTLPETVRDLFAAPFRRLPGETQEVLRVAAVGGVRVRHALLAAVTGLDGAGLAVAMRPAVTAKLLAGDGDGYRFRHAMIREVVREELLPGEREAVHERYAEALERRPELAGPDRVEAELAEHWHAVADRRPGNALLAAWRAAKAAFSSLAYVEEFAQLGWVLELWERAPEATGRLGVDRLAVVEEAIVAAGFTRADARALDLADALLAGPDTDPVRRSQLLVARSMLRHQQGLPGDLRDVRNAVRLIPAGHPARAGSLDMLARVLLYVPLEREGRAAAAEAAREARERGDAGLEIRAAASLAYADARAGADPAGQLARLDELGAAAAGSGDPLAVGRVARCRAEILLDLGRWADAARAAGTGLASLRDGQGRGVAHIHTLHLASAYLASGRWDEALQVLERPLAGGLGAAAGALLGLLRGEVALGRGDLDAAEAAVAEARAAFGWDTRYAHDFLLLERLDLELRLARGSDAAGLVAEVLTAGYPPAASRFLWPVLAIAARAAAGSTDLRRRLSALARRLPVVGPVQAAHRLTYLASARDAQGAWDEAAAAWAALGQPYPRARALVRAATAAGDRAAAKTGDRAAVAGRLRVAADLAAGLGAAPLLAEIESLIGPAPSRLGLSPREAEVLRLVAAGRTNREIAAALVISVKTADRHVSNILAKLGVDNRVQAAAVVHQLG